MPSELIASTNGDMDAAETGEWLDSLNGVLQSSGEERARFLLTQLGSEAGFCVSVICRSGISVPFLQGPFVTPSSHDAVGLHSQVQALTPRVGLMPPTLFESALATLEKGLIPSRFILAIRVVRGRPSRTAALF